MKKFRLKKGDRVIVIAGADKGLNGEILQVIPKTGRVIVSGVGKVKRHTSPSAKNKSGGIVEKFMPIHISNVAFYDAKTSKPSKVGYKVLEDGSKKRIAKVSGEIIE
jgi:large subunit ribosomal protein L24